MLIALLLTITLAPAQDSPQKLFESGKYQEAIDNVKGRSDASREDVFLRALAHRKLNQNDDAKEAFHALEGGDGAGDNAQARYQLGLVESARNNQQEAADAFAKAAELNPQMAYAHYEAGMAFYKAKKVDRMAVYFENFLRIAPNAPERPAVQSIMRTVRGR
jgi:tetratricopeptide (TPR) repeat protein